MIARVTIIYGKVRGSKGDFLMIEKETSQLSEFPDMDISTGNTLRIIHNSGNNERYTPEYIT